MESKFTRILNISISICLFTGIVGLLGGMVFEEGYPSVSEIFYIAGTVAEVIGIILMIIRFARYGIPKPEIQEIYEPQHEQKVVKTVDVKPVEETPEQKLFKQYEDLYKEGLISKEDLEKKRQELLR